MTNLESACDYLYDSFATLPRNHDTYHDWFGKHKNGSSYRVILDGTPNRRKSWDNLLCNYFDISWLDLLKDHNFEAKEWNTLLHSGIKIIDKDNNRKIVAYTPWYSPLVRVFFGGKDLIITRIKENYTSLPKRLKKNCGSFVRKMRQDYIPAVKEGCDIFSAIMAETGSCLASSAKEKYDNFTTKVKQDYVPFIEGTYDYFASSIKDSYNRFTSSVRKNYDSFTTKMKENYVPSIRKNYSSFINTLKEWYVSFKERWRRKH